MANKEKTSRNKDKFEIDVTLRAIVNVFCAKDEKYNSLGINLGHINI